MRNGKNLREYGLPDSTPTSTPEAKDMDKQIPCPNCGCERVMEITVEADQPLLKGGKGVGTYFGCPACPWASPMGIVATP